LKFVEIDNIKYVICGAVLADTKIGFEELKKKYGADTVLRRGKEIYLCKKMIEAEFEDIKDG
jgi:hypothetical protein|tara:strand:- start:6803 stop:6988 length:186 start_codon:yes stop_codon:yes gene_type:complete